MTKGTTRPLEIPKEMRAVVLNKPSWRSIVTFRRLRKPFPPSTGGSRRARSARRASPRKR